MRQLDKLTDEAMAQSLNDLTISENLSESFKNTLKNLGSKAVFGILALGITGLSPLAHGMDNKAFGWGLGASGLMGLANNNDLPQNLPPECRNIQGKSGWQIGGAGAAGALVGSNVGKGSGSKWAAALGTIMGTGLANNSEENRIRNECEAIINQINQQMQQHSTPTHNKNFNTPTADILYEGRTVSGESLFITMDNSPGVLALKGNMQGEIDVFTNPTVLNGIQKSIENLNQSYINLENVSNKYIGTVNGTEKEIFNPNPDMKTNYRKSTAVSRIANDYEKNYNEYALKRGIAAHILDEAATRNYNLNQFRASINLFVTPKSAKVTYSSIHNKDFENRYANGINLPNKLK